MIQVQLPYFIDLRTSTGIHETYTEQHVPLIVVSKINQDMIPYPIGTIIDEQVGVIDIIPTITHLNGCGSEDTFDGTTFLIYQRFKNMYNNAKNSFLIYTNGSGEANLGTAIYITITCFLFLPLFGAFNKKLILK